MNHGVTFELLWNGSVANEPGQQKDVHFVFTPLLILARLLPLQLPHFPQQLVFLLPPFFLLPLSAARRRNTTFFPSFLALEWKTLIMHIHILCFSDPVCINIRFV